MEITKNNYHHNRVVVSSVSSSQFLLRTCFSNDDCCSAPVRNCPAMVTRGDLLSRGQSAAINSSECHKQNMQNFPRRISQKQKKRSPMLHRLPSRFSFRASLLMKWHWTKICNQINVSIVCHVGEIFNKIKDDEDDDIQRRRRRFKLETIRNANRGTSVFAR